MVFAAKEDFMGEEERPESAAGAEEEAARLLEEYERQILALPVREHLERMLTTLSGLALQRLGLGDKEAGAYEPKEAGLAIDAFRALVEVLVKEEPQLTGVYRATLAQMQLAFASVAEARSAPEREAGAAAGRTEPQAEPSPQAEPQTEPQEPPQAEPQTEEEE